MEGQRPRRLGKKQDSPAEPGQLWCAADYNPIIKSITCSTEQACLCWDFFFNGLTAVPVVVVVVSEDFGVLVITKLGLILHLVEEYVGIKGAA